MAKLRKDTFRFSEEALLQISSPQVTRDTFNEKGFALVVIDGQYTVRTSAYDDVYTRALSEIRSVIVRLEARLKGGIKHEIAVRTFNRSAASPDTSHSPIEFQVQFTVKIGAELTGPELLENIRAVKFSIDRSADWILDTMNILEVGFGDAVPEALRPIMIDFNAVILQFQKLPKFELIPTKEEELFILEQRKKTLTLSKEEESILLQRRKEQRKKVKVPVREEPIREEPPRRKGIIERTVDFFSGLFRR